MAENENNNYEDNELSALRNLGEVENQAESNGLLESQENSTELSEMEDDSSVLFSDELFGDIDEDSTELAVVEEKPNELAKTKKMPKMVSQKKLPKMFRKRYSERAYKKLLKKIFIGADKKLVVSVLEKQLDKKGRVIYIADKTKEIPKRNLARLKLVAKQIKKQKKGIRLVPLLAVVVVVAGIGITVTTFKNRIVKKAIVSAMQGIFQAKTDIERVNLEIFGASLRIRGLQQANKNEPMKNLFQIDDIYLDFNLNDLLKGKFHAEKLNVEGVAVGTARKTSGELPKKVKEKKEDSKIVKIIVNEKDSLVNSAKNEMIALFDRYNPERILEQLQNDLKSPALAQTIYNDVLEKIAKWEVVPAMYEKSIIEFSDTIRSIVETDWATIYDYAVIKSLVDNVKVAVNQGQDLTKTIIGTVEDIKSDTMLAFDYTKQIQSSLINDKNVIESKVNELKVLFTLDGLTDIMCDSVKSIVYDYTSRFGPYATQVVDYAMNSLNDVKAKIPVSKSEKKEKKAKKEARKRAAGRDIYYRRDRVPKFLVDETIASGYEYGKDQLLFKGVLRNVSSNQDVTGKDTSLDVMFNILGNPNNANLVVDARSNTKAPLVKADYKGQGFDISANAEVFALKSKSDITAMFSADKNGNFNVGGYLDMNVISMTGMDFEPAIACRIYQNALAEIKELAVGFEMGYRNGKLTIELKDLDKLILQLVKPIEKALMDELTLIIETAKMEAVKLLAEKTGIAAETILKFTNISTAMEEIQKQAEFLKVLLEQKQKEIADTVIELAKKTANDALKNLIPPEWQNIIPADIDALKAMIPTNTEALKDLLSSDALKEMIPLDTDALKNMIPMDADALKNMIPTDADALKNMIPTDADALKNLIPTDADALKNMIPTDAEALKNIIPTDADALKNMIPNADVFNPSAPNTDALKDMIPNADTFKDMIPNADTFKNPTQTNEGTSGGEAIKDVFTNPDSLKKLFPTNSTGNTDEEQTSDSNNEDAKDEEQKKPEEAAKDAAKDMLKGLFKR